jgi:hypothetical protein
MPVETGAKMSLCCLARLESGLVGAMLQSWCWSEFGCGCDRGWKKNAESRQLTEGVNLSLGNLWNR